MDIGQKLTEEELKKLERRIAKEYKTAVKEMEQKLTDYLEETEAGRQVQLQLYRAGKISKDDYESWVYRHTMVGRRWEAMRDTLAADMHRTNEIAKAMSEGQAADVFALNGNFATYQLEHDGKIDTGFTLYNHDTAQYLLEDQRQLMPVPSDKKAREIAANKDMKWNMKKIQSAVLQGVMQGESPYAVAERLEQVGQMNHNSAVRYARTMTTSAQNAGRYEAYRRADKLGVNLSIEWQATLDSRTRNDHRLMHGQRRKVDEPFILPDGQKILFPADCTHNSYELQGEIWNCRCTLLSWVKGFEGDTVKDSPKMDGMSFEEWQHAKEPKAPKVERQTFFKPLDETFVGGGYTEEDIARINTRFQQLDETYHAEVSGIVTTLSRDQAQYDLYYNNYVNKLLSENPRMRASTAEKRAVELLGERPKTTSIFLGGDYNMVTKKMTLNIDGAKKTGGIAEDIESRIKKRERDEKRRLAGRPVFGAGNVGGTAESNFIHEYGHAIDATYKVSENERFKEFYRTFSEKDIELGVSSYATTNEQEFIAECFCESFMGETQGEISKRFMKILEEIIG